jgi:hypothetical protein
VVELYRLAALGQQGEWRMKKEFDGRACGTRRADRIPLVERGGVAKPRADNVTV